MAKKLQWQDDPVVVLEKAVLPIVSLAPAAIARHAVGKDVDHLSVDAPFKVAHRMLRKQAVQMLDERKIPYTADQVAPIAAAATATEEFRTRLSDIMGHSASRDAQLALLDLYSDDLVPKIDAAIDAFRSIFIGCVLERHWQHAKRADEAIDGLDRISKQIFFISINASVEAARVGEAGRGFLQISTDIRALAQSAQASTRGLANLAEDQQNLL